MYKNLLAALIFGGVAVAGGIQAGDTSNDANTASTQQQQKAVDGTMNSSWNNEWERQQKAAEETRKKVADMQAKSAAEFEQLDREYEAGKAEVERRKAASAANGEKIRQQYEAGKAKVDAAMNK